jgi:hypothetical protein
MEYDQLIAEIMQGGLRRMRDKRREERELERSRDSAKNQDIAKLAADKADKGKRKNGNGNGNGNGEVRQAVRREKSEPTIQREERREDSGAEVVPLPSTSTH